MTGPVNRQYARRHNYAYCDYVGNVSRVSNTANFNRYYLIRKPTSLRQLQEFGRARTARILASPATGIVNGVSRRGRKDVPAVERNLDDACPNGSRKFSGNCSKLPGSSSNYMEDSDVIS